MLIVILAFSGCESNPLYKSKINLNTDGFVITSIQKGVKGHIICTGFQKESEAPMVLEYNEELNYHKTTNLSNRPKYKGFVKLTSLQENGYLATCFLNQEIPQRLMLYRTDVNFNVVNEYEVAQWNDTISAVNVRVLKELKNGDFIIAFDSMGNRNQLGGFRIQRFDKNLKPLFTYSDNIQNYVSSYSPRLVELFDESIFYVLATNNGDVNGPFKSLRTGRLTKTGSSMFANFTKVDYQRIQPIGLSIINNKMIYQMMVNTDIIHIMSIDFNSGDITLDKEMSYNEVNHFQQYGAFPNYYPFILPSNILTIGEANPMPTAILPKQGQVIFTKATGKLFHLQLDDQLNFEPTFNIPLPNFEAISSYRQMYLDDGKIVVGSSYIYHGKPYFNMLMLNADGTLVQ